MAAASGQVKARAASVRGLALGCTLAIAVLSGTSGCSTNARPDLYAWDGYEQLVYDSYLNPGNADPATQIARLSQAVTRAEIGGGHIAPGIHAHLGYMYYLNGQPDAAREHFTAEKQLFPASTVFMDVLMGGLAKK